MLTATDVAQAAVPTPAWQSPERRLGSPGYAALLRAVVEPATAATAGAALGIKASTAARLLREFHRHGLVHVADWVRAGKPRSPYVPQYRAGRGEDAAVPTSVRGSRVLPRPLCLEFCRLTSIVMDGSMTVVEFADEAGIERWEADRYLRMMRAKRLLYVARWDTSGHKPVRAWGWGPGKHSAKRPKRKPEVDRNWRRRRNDQMVLLALRGEAPANSMPFNLRA